MASNRGFLGLALTPGLALFCQTLHALDLSEQRDPLGPLQMRLDYGLSNRDGRNWEVGHQWVFSTRITFNGPVTTIRDSQLKKLADAVYKEMGADIQQYDLIIDKKLQKPIMQPGVVTVLAFGNELAKETAAFITKSPRAPIRQQMELCRALFTDFNINFNPAQQDHKNGRKCGEVTAFHQYYQLHSQPLQERTPLARAGTVHRIKSEGNQLELIDPCGAKDEASISS
ncbi:unnamed protein product [Clonostachys rosea]|uniref:Uncharacterized protein n=1 Tax=Bionectria ochroleuca TaxID=29856 RepID=A0ABY6V2A8_BIOOC|nr:unnamed protein product [Clonostachys rosea]